MDKEQQEEADVRAGAGCFYLMVGAALFVALIAAMFFMYYGMKQGKADERAKIAQCDSLLVHLGQLPESSDKALARNTIERLCR